jgi:CheY-like chemotaxis protein
MKADVTKVRQILFNLLSNACKFTTKGAVEVRAARFNKDLQDWIRFQVTDTGIGIASQQLTRLFQDFSQADASTTRKYGGTGLGLSICRRLTRMMGGEITVDSQPGKGSTFTVELPAEVVSGKRKSRELSGFQTSTSSSRDRSANTILVIDDDPSVHELIQRYLGRDGLHIVTTTSGEEGLRLAHELRPGAITLDLLMPGMDGWSVLTALKADPELSGIPVTMLSILSEQNQAFSLGAADYLTKPIDRDQLAKVIQKYRSAHLGRPILVVEDDATTREMMSRLVTNLGCLAVEAENGRVALERVAENPPKLVLLDLMMPEMDGFQFIEKIRENESWRSIPVVVVTAMELTEEDQNRLNGGIRQMILKKASSSPEELLRNVRDLLVAS